MAGKIITIAQQKGGAGKTTVAAHLSVGFATSGAGRVALLDVDPQGSIGHWLETREKHFGEDGTGLEFRTASAWGARREADRLARNHDIVIIDTPPNAEQEARPAIIAADLVIVPVQPTPIDLWATRSTLEAASSEGVEAAVVLNRVPPRANLTGEIADAMQDLYGHLLNTRLGNRVAFAASIGRGQTVMETEPKGVAAAEISDLIAELTRRFLK
jgi:chromosome partitioning protein